jgi:hypothetical protein
MIFYYVISPPLQRSTLSPRMAGATSTGPRSSTRKSSTVGHERPDGTNPRETKRVCWQLEPTEPTGNPKKCYLTLMPFELLAEILIYTASPRDILALARTSQFFCATLVNRNSSVFIWRNARHYAKPQAIPDPTPDFTEPAYATFLFDGGKCEVLWRSQLLVFAFTYLTIQICAGFTQRPHISFALRLRICGKVSFMNFDMRCLI